MPLEPQNTRRWRQSPAQGLVGAVLFLMLPVMLSGLPPARAQQAAPAQTASAPAASQTQAPQTPQALYQDLFSAVAESNILPDGKAFPDAVPRASPADILARYHAEPPASPSALKAFVSAQFTLPPDDPAPPASQAPVTISAHIHQLWDVLTRNTATAPRYSSLLAVPQPYVVPGGRFREMYYWDSYFTMLGLIEDGRRDLAQSMVADFAYLIDTYGHVPNGLRSYYLSRSQPPFFFEMVRLLSPGDPGSSLARYLPQLRREYAYWMDGATGLAPGKARRHAVALPDGSILNRYWDALDVPRDESYAIDTRLAATAHRNTRELYRDLRAAAESGWDFSSRWLADGKTLGTIITTQIVPVDLNSLLFGLENAIREGCAYQHDEPCAQDFARRAKQRHAAIDRYLWDAAGGVYRDYRWTTNAPINRVSAATFYPLFEASASATQARAVATAASQQLLKTGGLVTTTQTTGQQWDAPNGWAPLQWIAISGLRHYAQPTLAEAIACRWMFSVNQVYGASAKLVEKYNVVNSKSGGGGEYPTQDGFGWTNGVMRKLMALYPADAERRTLSQCPEPEVEP